MEKAAKVTARIDYTVDTRRGSHTVTTRKSKEVSASPEKLPGAIERVMKKLDDVDAYNVQVSYESTGGAQ